ncbi:MAG: B12-binding domain-containing radical SAM protein [Desulfobacteraceae bacterium]|nr:B12-binding domain-containing radical SAM protein [Desulfobacteraceae bacterium]
MSDGQMLRSKKPLKMLISPPMDRCCHRKVTVPALNDGGLGYVASACDKVGADVTLLSWNTNLDKIAFRQKLLELRPEVVGLKVFTTMFKEAYETLRCVRETLPDAITVIGGPHASTSRPEDIFVEFEGLLDFAIAGDGENGIVGLLDEIAAAGGKPTGNGLSRVPGLVYSNGDDVRSNERYLDAELDNLAPIDWSLQQPAWFGTSHGLDGVSTGALVSDSRGCPAQCGFCLSNIINGPKPRHRSMKNLCAEIEELAHKYGARVLVFTGNAFLSDVDYVRELCEWLIKLDTPLEWSCTGSAYDRNLKDPELLSLMRRAGCNLIYFGIESGSPGVRERLCQPVPLDDCTEIVKLTAKAGIRPGCYFMFGFPDETVQEMDETIRYAFSLPFHSVSFIVCLPLPGTSSYKAVLQRQGIDRIDWSTYDFARPDPLPCKATPAQVRRKLFKTAILKRSKFARRVYNLTH